MLHRSLTVLPGTCRGWVVSSATPQDKGPSWYGKPERAFGVQGVGDRTGLKKAETQDTVALSGWTPVTGAQSTVHLSLQDSWLRSS